jgi:glycosyltransferase involved in cell wall biosynthesis
LTSAPLTIITPTYNAAATLAACVESVAVQTLLPLEHWIIDGASTDQTIGLIKELVAKYPHLKYISEPDQGIYHAMNKGIDLAKGEWIYFLGADDSLYDKNILEYLFSQKNNAQIIYGDVLMVSKEQSYRYGGKFDIERILRENICHQAIITHKDVFKQLGRFSPDFPVWADWEFNLRWFLSKNIQSIYVNRLIANYSRDGYSSQRGDPAFVEKREKLILKYGHETLDPKLRSYLFYCYKLGSHNAQSLWRRLSVKLQYQIYRLTGRLF